MRLHALRPRDPHRLPSPPAWLLLVLLATACSDGGAGSDSPLPSGPAAPVEYLTLRAEGEANEGATKSYLRFDFPRDREKISKARFGSFETTTLFREDRKDRYKALRLEGKRVDLYFKEDFDPARFNQVVVTMTVYGKSDVAVSLSRKGEEIVRTHDLRFEGGDGRGEVSVTLELPETLREEHPIDTLILHSSKVLRPANLVALELVHRPISRWLPKVADGPRPVLIHEEQRLAVGLASTSPLHADFEARGGARLAFAFGRPSSVARRGRAPRLLVQLRDEHGEERSFDARVPYEGPAPWIDAAVSLEGLRGRVTATFSLEPWETELDEFCALASPRIERPSADAPTVVFVTSDTHRGDYVGLATDGVDVRTPFLDALAARGVFFEDCFSTTNITIPSHTSMLTGLPPRDTRLVDNTSSLSEGADTLAERFRAAGFATVAVVSTRSLGDERSGLGQGFDRASVPQDAYVDSITRIPEVERLTAGLKGVPLFLWLHVFDAHAPYTPADEYVAGYYEGDPYDKSLPEPEHPAPWDSEARDPAYIESLYRGEVTQLDNHIAKALSAPRFENAVIALTADHGESLGNHDIWYKHKGLYPDTISVPLILAWPGAPAGKRVTQGASNVEIGRTLLDLAGLEHVPFPGQSILRYLDDEAPAEPRYAMASHGVAASIELAGWHLVLNLSGHRYPQREKHQVELYYLPDDKACANDLVDAEHERATRMRQLLVDWLAQARTEALSSAKTMSAEDLAELSALGYSAGDAEGHAGIWYKPDPESPWVQRFE